MVGVKLRSGKLSEFVATGTDGAPVYTSSDQLRVAIRRHLGQESADYFAVAKPNDTGDGIEWYAPNRGTVIPWSSATEQEKTDAKAMLVEAREKILLHSAALLKNENPEQQLFGKMLEKSVRIPDDSHVYIVNGKPVMTFWGFDKPNAPAGADIIKTLVAVPNTPNDPPPTVEHDVIQEKKRPFWWWLIPLLLLLLLLLIFLWWHFQKNPENAVTHNNALQEDTLEDPAFFSEDDIFGNVPVDEEQDTNINDIDQTDADTTIRYGDDRDYYGGTRNIDTTRINGDNIDNISDIRDTDITNNEGVLENAPDDLVAVDNSEENLNDAVIDDAIDVNGEDSSIEEEIMDDEGTLVDSDSLEEDVPVTDPIDVTGDAAMDALGQDNLNENNEAGENVPAAQQGNADETQPATPPQSQGAENNNANQQNRRSQNSRSRPLRIPPEALRNGSTEFMDGEWASHAGLIDSETGKPIKVEYDINDGAGKARIKRPDGSVCSGDVGTSIENGQLVIAGQNAIRCPDGVTYDTSKVVCSSNADGSGTDCKGINNNGSDYPVRLRQSQ